MANNTIASGSFETSTNLYDMQLHRLKKMIHASRDIRVIAVLAELAMQYMDGEVDIIMENGEMKFLLVKNDVSSESGNTVH